MAVERHREYETVFILRPSAGEDVAQETRDRVEGVIENGGGHVLRFDNWGSRKLAYEIMDKTENVQVERGTYQYYRFMGPNDLVAEVERNLRLLDSVIKYLTVKLDEDLIADERLKKPTEVGDLDVTDSEE
jgi:small subunit ribosomal protein S6